MNRVARASVVVGIVALLAASGCRSKSATFDAPQHPLFKDLKQPPLNLPRPVSAIVPQPGVSPQAGPGIVISRGGLPFEGSTTASGQVSVNNERVEFMGAKQPLDIRYRLPRELPFPAAYTGTADVTVTEASNPGGPDTQLWVRTGGTPLLAVVIRKSAEPIRFELSPDLFLDQSPVDVNAKQRIAPSRVRARNASGMATDIAVGQLTRVQVPGVTLNVYVRASYRVLPSQKAQHAGGYILDAWIARVNQP